MCVDTKFDTARRIYLPLATSVNAMDTTKHCMKIDTQTHETPCIYWIIFSSNILAHAS